MRYIILLFIFLIINPLVFAMSDYESLTMDVTISTSIDVTKKVDKYDIEFINVNLSFLPYDDKFQKRNSLSTNPKSDQFQDHIVFSFKNPIIGNNPIELNSSVTVFNRFTEIDKKIMFPIKNLDSKSSEYTKATEKIDSNNLNIIEKAGFLASGQDDLIVVLHKIAEYVNTELTYDTSETFNLISGTKPASWVLSNKIGVCDEYSVLFIALARSLGIPARYVSGIAYTNYMDLNNWGPHAWAEVYIPEYGWMPYDVTYGQFMHVDASHVKLKESYDADESSINFEWRARNIDVHTNAMDIKASLSNKGRILSPNSHLTVSPVKNKAGFGSYNLIEISIENLKPYYISEKIQIAQTRELEMIDEENDMFILLKPKERKKIYYIVRIKDDLNKDFVYTIPSFVRTLTNASAQGEISSTSTDPIYTLQDMKELKETLSPKEDKLILKDISLECKSNKPYYYNYEESEILCVITNIGNVPLNGVKVCLKDDCKSIDIGIARSENLNFITAIEKIGDVDYTIRAEINEVSTSKIVSFQSFDEPSIEPPVINSPEEVGYSESFTISLNVKKSSFSVPQNISLYYYIKDIMVAEMHAVELNLDHNFQLQLTGKDLMQETGYLRVDIIYHDKNGKSFIEKAETIIKIKDLNFMQKILLFMSKIEMKIASLF